ncbi:MAG: phosphodiester glycosidase family protein [Clostridia bacterium]|nr:phosphodiester glycosidase family protein [Clostridia bacterium]
MRIHRKITAVIAATTLILSATPALAADSIYELTEETTIATGIVRKNIKRLTSKGWQNINIIEADISDGRYGVKTLTDTEDISVLNNVKTLAQEHSTLAAINGDFFSWKSDEKTKGSAVGGVVIDGVLKTSVTAPWNFATVAQNEEGEFIFDYIDCNIQVTTSDGFTIDVEHINKYDDLTYPIIYTKEWSPLSVGSAGTLSEIVVEDGKVVAVNYDQGPVEFPENGYIIAFLRDLYPEYTEKFAVGEEVALTVNYTPEFDDIKFAVGAGTLLLKDGEKTEIINDVAGYHPRTAIGVDKDGEKLYLVTVDGRRADSKGVTLDMLSEIMAEIGADDAANLDGGGSTTLVAKSPYTGVQTVMNNTVDGYLRSVANGIGIVPLEAADKDGFITIETDSNYVFKDTSIFLNVKVHDSHGNFIDAHELKWKAEGGSVKDGFYTPHRSGKHKVTVTYKGMSATKEFTVLDEPVKIYAGLKEYKIDTGKEAYISLMGEDEKGYKAYINLSDTEITLSSAILEVEGNSIIGKKKGTALATFNIGDVQTSVLIRVGGDTEKKSIPADITTEKEMNFPDDESKILKFAVFGNTVEKNTLTERLVLFTYGRMLNDSDYDLAVFAGDTLDTPKGIKTDVIKTTDYSVSEYKGSTFITLDSMDFAHWDKLFREAKEYSGDNLFIILTEGINDDKAYTEEALTDYVEKYLGNTNVYVISHGDGKILKDSGITHIPVPGMESIGSAKTAAEDAYYYSISVYNDSFKCEKIKIFEGAR